MWGYMVYMVQSRLDWLSMYFLLLVLSMEIKLEYQAVGTSERVALCHQKLKFTEIHTSTVFTAKHVQNTDRPARLLHVCIKEDADHKA